MAVISAVVILVLLYRLSAYYSVPWTVTFGFGDPLGIGVGAGPAGPVLARPLFSK